MQEVKAVQPKGTGASPVGAWPLRWLTLLARAGASLGCWGWGASTELEKSVTGVLGGLNRVRKSVTGVLGGSKLELAGCHKGAPGV